MEATARVLADMLENYRGRDQIMRLTSYSCCFLGGVLNNSNYKALAQSLTIFSAHLSECRTVLRLFDDLSMFFYCRRFGLGFKENDLFLRITSLIDNFLGQAYYPMEHLAWARDRKILTGSSDRLWTVSILFWLGNLVIAIIQCMWRLRILRCKENHLDKCSGESESVQSQRHLYRARQRQLVVTIIGSIADAGNAIHWLPEGFLWGGKSSQVVVGLLGTISSLSLLFNSMNPVNSETCKDS